MAKLKCTKWLNHDVSHGVKRHLDWQAREHGTSFVFCTLADKAVDLIPWLEQSTATEVASWENVQLACEVYLGLEASSWKGEGKILNYCMMPKRDCTFYIYSPPVSCSFAEAGRSWVTGETCPSESQVWRVSGFLIGWLHNIDSPGAPRSFTKLPLFPSMHFSKYQLTSLVNQMPSLWL